MVFQKLPENEGLLSGPYKKDLEDSKIETGSLKPEIQASCRPFMFIVT